MLKNINWPSCFVLIGYPVLLIALGINYSLHHDIGWFETTLMVVGYYGSNIAVGVGLHRLWSHNGFKTNKFIEFILVMMSAGTLQGPTLSWASNHYKHHTFTDKEEDPHSPLKYKNRFVGFLWSHIGWMLVGEGSYKSIDRLTMVKLGKNKLLRWQLKHYWKLAVFMNVILPAIIGYALGGTLFYAYVAFLFIGLGRALQQQATFCVNSVTHFIGTKKYYKGTAGDIWWMAPFLLGENWHNYHHAFPSDYRNGAKWYHADVHKWIIYALSKVGLAWDLNRTPEVRVAAKAKDTMMYLVENRKERLGAIQTKIDSLTQSLYTKLEELENSSNAVKAQVKKSFEEINASLKSLADNLQSSVKLTESSSERLLKAASQKLKHTENTLKRLYNKLDNSSNKAFS